MNEWKEIKLGEISKVKGGKRLPKGEFVINKKTKYPYLRITDLNDSGKVNLKSICYITEDIHKKIKKYTISQKDIFITIAGTIGLVGKVPNALDNCNLTENCAKLMLNEKLVKQDFVLYFLRLKNCKELFVSYSSGSSQPKLALKSIRNFKIQLPDLVTQKKIANVLSTYDELIENNNRRIEVLEQTAEEIYKEWFVRMRFPGYENTKLVKGIPEGWEVKKVNNLGEVVTGKTPSTKVAEYYGGEIMFIKTPDMHGNIFTSQTETYLSEDGSNSQANKLLPQDSIMVSCIGTGGVVSINMFPAHTNQQINSIILEDTKIREWAFLTLKSMKQTIELFGATGATMTNLSKGKFEGLKLLYPSDELLNKFNNITKPMFEELKSIILTNENLIKQRDLLLPRLMNGTIEVK